MQRTVERTLFALLRFEINGTEFDKAEQNLITTELLSSLFKLAKKHDLAHLIGDALERNGLFSNASEVRKRFLYERVMAIYRYEQMQYELEEICKSLEKAQIPFLPLKGSVLRQYYPAPWMRTSCDIDILVPETMVESAKNYIIDDLHYTYGGGTTHDILLCAENGVHLELHYNLIESYIFENNKPILENIWETLSIKDGLRYHREMRDEVFYVYHLAHMAKHFMNGGCGIRPFLDLWIMKQKMPCNEDLLQYLLKQAGLLLFYENACKLSEYWLSEGKTDDTIKEMEYYVLRGGVYGTVENKIAVNRGKARDKFSYIFSSLFLSYENLCIIYPSLKGRKLLTPFYQVKRWFRKLFKGASKDVRATLRAYDVVTDEQKQHVNNLLKKIGLSNGGGTDS